MIAWLLFAASAVAQWSVSPRETADDSSETGPGSMSVVPYLAVVVGYGSLFLAALDRRTPTLGGIVVGAIALTATVLVRQAIAVRENVRLSAEGAARQSEARFRTLVQNSSDLIAVVDLDTTIRYQSPSVERVLGYRPEELDGNAARRSRSPGRRAAGPCARDRDRGPGRAPPPRRNGASARRDGQGRSSPR